MWENIFQLVERFILFFSISEAANDEIFRERESLSFPMAFGFSNEFSTKTVIDDELKWRWI